MEKILLAIDAIDMDRSTLSFACYLARLTNSTITGVFLENLVGEQRPVLKRLHGRAFLDWEFDEESEEHQLKMELVEKNIALFKETCAKRSVNFNVHRDRGVPTSELIEESRFADLIIVDAQTSFRKKYEESPTDFVRAILKRAECPVIVAPEHFEAIDEIVFAYDGSALCMFAIKQFTHLFPQFSEKKTIILHVRESNAWIDPDKHQFREWLKSHYSNLNFETVEGSTEEKLFDFVYGRKNVFVVMGAYGRGLLSRMFKHSSADSLIEKVSQPIFVAHQ